MEQLCRIIFSRWTTFVVIVAVVVAAALRSSWVWIVVSAIVGVIILCAVAVFVVAMRHSACAWRKFPDTSEYREYMRSRNADSRRNNEDKNKLEIK